MQQPIMGICCISQDEAEHKEKASALLKTLSCEIVDDRGTRLVIKTSRGNLQSIKKRWEKQDKTDSIGQALTNCISRIIIGSMA
jgi:hypothetical protein